MLGSLSPEILPERGEGRAFVTRNAALLAEKIAEFASDMERTIHRGKAARKTVATRFGLDRMVWWVNWKPAL
jgi:hypothetical protein